MLRIAAPQALGAVLAALVAYPAAALEYPVGAPKNANGMEIAAVYLQPVDMEPEGHMRKAAEADVHMEADIHALANNQNGYPEGAWVPFLQIRYSSPSCRPVKRSRATSCRWWRATVRIMATTSSSRGRANTG